MIDKVRAADCVLCGSCVNVCPTGAITYEKPYLDFRYPSIDSQKCVGCEKCEGACPVLHPAAPEKEREPEAFVARNPDEHIRKHSSSGGIFMALAASVLEQGGYVCGAVFDEDFHVRHAVSNDRNTVMKMMGSKYVQSDLSGVSRQIKRLLTAGTPVLFSGCPCQIAGLRAYLGKPFPNLLLVEVICHGVPSDTMLQSYLDFRQAKAGAKVSRLVFRDKEKGWHRSAVKIEFENGKRYLEPITSDPYMRGFLGAVVLKESCYHCAFNQYRSGSDLILGDFWGAEAVCPDRDDNKGLSAVIVNTQAGKAALEKLNLDRWRESLEILERYNQNLVCPTKRNPRREAFYRYAGERGYQKAIRKFFCLPMTVRMKNVLRCGLRRLRHMLTGKGKNLY